MFSARIASILAATLIVGACKTTPSIEPVCPERVTTWMVCPGTRAKEGSVCQVYGPPLGCGFDEIAIENANNWHVSRDLEFQGRFYIFAIAVMAQGASRISNDEAPQRPTGGMPEY